MRSASAQEGKSWLAAIGVIIDPSVGSWIPRYMDGRACRAYETPFADHFSAAHDMARELLTPAPRPHFPGGLLWLYRWEEWPIARHTVERMRKGYGVTADLAQHPVHLFDQGEALDAVAMMGLMMTYGWDCFFVAADATYMALSCNEMILTLVVGDEQARAWYEPIINALGFDELGGAGNRFCHPPGR